MTTASRFSEGTASGGPPRSRWTLPLVGAGLLMICGGAGLSVESRSAGQWSLFALAGVGEVMLWIGLWRAWSAGSQSDA